MIRAPEFWAKPSHPLAALLAPLSWAWRAGNALAAARHQPHRIGVPVLSVGNLVLGGAGKTPVTLALAERLQAMGAAPHILGKGYGGAERGPLRVDAAKHSAAAVGDEALLHARTAPTWVARDRLRGAIAVLAGGGKIILLDDGHQTWALEKSLSLVVVDGGYGFGNRRVFPAGPLREPVRSGLARADLIVVVGDPGAELEGRLMRDLQKAAKPVLWADLVAGPEAGAFRGQDVLAFAGIGRPEKFFASVRAIGANLVASCAYPDHHRYSAADLAMLRKEAANIGAKLLTTAKDAVRLSAADRADISVLDVRLEFREPARIDAYLQALIAQP